MDFLDGRHALLFFLGYVIGFGSSAWVMQLFRCENCCQKDRPEDDSSDYWMKQLGRRKEDRE